MLYIKHSCSCFQVIFGTQIIKWDAGFQNLDMSWIILTYFYCMCIYDWVCVCERETEKECMCVCVFVLFFWAMPEMAKQEEKKGRPPTSSNIYLAQKKETYSCLIFTY